MGMNSRLLSLRARQPGHDRTFRMAEENFIEALEAILDRREWEIQDHPRDLRRIIGGRFGIVPEASIEFLPTGRKFFFEVKKQGPAGNADERACKHHTVQFYKELHSMFGYDYHPFATIMCDSLATMERYTVKHPFYFEPDHYFCWVDYDLDSLADFVARVASQWLMDTRPGAPQLLPQ